MGGRQVSGRDPDNGTPRDGEERVRCDGGLRGSKLKGSSHWSQKGKTKS